MEFGELLKRCVRILHISRKPTPSEFNKVAKVTALGMVAFGVIGLVVSIVFGFI